MSRKWFSIAALIVTATSLLVGSSCGDSQELVSIAIVPSTETVGAANIPLTQDTGFQVQLSAQGTYVHPPVTKDITNQVTWTSNTPQMFTVSSTGLLTATGQECGGAIVSASLTTNSDSSGVSSSGAVVTGYMNANLTCFTSTGPTVTIDSAGAGAGTISSSPAGLGCSLSGASSCTGSFPIGTPLTLTATPTSGTFGSWSGCDSTSGTQCTINDLTNNVTLTVTFN
jgi:hypothetical protein